MGVRSKINVGGSSPRKNVLENVPFPVVLTEYLFTQRANRPPGWPGLFTSPSATDVTLRKTATK